MTVSTEALLDKLYNLRGEDSDILREMDRQKNKAEETKSRTTVEKGRLQTTIADLKKSREELQDQGEKLKDTLQGIRREDYDTVLTRLRIDFDPKNLLDKLERNLPKTIETVERDTKKAEDELVKVEEEMNSAITTIEEIGIRKDTALANQEKLNEYFELALTGHINITRDSITSLLEEFGFNEEEQRETAKILMFPEDALFMYDEKMKAREKSGKSIGEVIQEAKEIVEEEKIEETPQIVVEEPIPDIDLSQEITDPKDEMISTLKEEGIDYLDFSSDEVIDLLNHYDKELIKENIRYTKSLNLENDMYVNHITLLYDKELKNKIEMLLNVGKDKMDIYLNPNVLVKYSYEQLENKINAMKSNGITPSEIPFIAY